MVTGFFVHHAKYETQPTKYEVGRKFTWWGSFVPELMYSLLSLYN